MGIIEKDNNIPFTEKDVSDKELVIKMLKYEDSIYLGEIGSKIYGDKAYRPTISLDPEYTINRMVLLNFGFDTTDESVLNYRSIFKHYYKSAKEYDNEVLSSVTYMRNNKCVYYDTPIINVGDIMPNCKLYNLDGETTTDIYRELGDYNYAFVSAFSTS